MVAIRAAAAALGSWRLDGCTLVVTLEPCTMCAGAAVLARLERVVFGAFDPKAGAVGSLWDVVRDRRLNHRPEVVSGVRAEESTALLDEFFAAAPVTSSTIVHLGGACCLAPGVRMRSWEGSGPVRRGAAAAALTAFGAVVGLAAPSYADDTVTVQGTAFPDPARANLSFVGCADLYQRTDEALAPTIGVGPGAAPSGTRSLGWDLAGGNAVGALFPVDSMRHDDGEPGGNSAGRATGVAYAGYQEPADAGTSLLWLGRSELVTPGGAWQTVDATTRVYTWTKYDMTTRPAGRRRPGRADHGGRLRRGARR